MIKVNLISKKHRAYKGRNWTRLVSYALFGAFSLYFAGTVLYVVIATMSFKSKITNVEKETKSVSAVLLENNEKLNRFVLTKLILSEIQDVNKNRFRYKDYLDELSSILPTGSSIVTVDFKINGWLGVTINATNVLDFRAEQDILLNKQTWDNNKYFSSAYVESVSRERDGAYAAKLQLELKKIDGTK